MVPQSKWSIGVCIFDAHKLSSSTKLWWNVFEWCAPASSYHQQRHHSPSSREWVQDYVHCACSRNARRDTLLPNIWICCVAYGEWNARGERGTVPAHPLSWCVCVCVKRLWTTWPASQPMPFQFYGQHILPHLVCPKLREAIIRAMYRCIEYRIDDGEPNYVVRATRLLFAITTNLMASSSTKLYLQVAVGVAIDREQWQISIGNFASVCACSPVSVRVNNMLVRPTKSTLLIITER